MIFKFVAHCFFCQRLCSILCVRRMEEKRFCFSPKGALLGAAVTPKTRFFSPAHGALCAVDVDFRTKGVHPLSRRWSAVPALCARVYFRSSRVLFASSHVAAPVTLKAVCLPRVTWCRIIISLVYAHIHSRPTGNSRERENLIGLLRCCSTLPNFQDFTRTKSYKKYFEKQRSLESIL